MLTITFLKTSMLNRTEGCNFDVINDTFKIGKNKVEFHLTPSDKRELVCNRKRYPSLESFLNDHQEINRHHNPKNLAKIVNFLSSGIEYYLIEDNEQYQKEYHDEDLVNSIHQFNTLSLCPPHISNGELIFYVRQVSTGTPFRVRCTYPIPSSNPPVKYENLEFINS